jgi:ABC-2 type transport system permease protein
MKAYLAVLGARFRVLLQYRSAAAAGVGTQLFWGLIRMMIFEAFYLSSTVIQPMSLANVISYNWLGQALLGLLPWNIDSELRTLVRSGNVAYELVRPLDLFNFWYARSVAHRLAPTLLKSIPLLIVARLWLGLQAPASWSSFAAWLIATLGALAMAAAISTLMALSLLWTVSGEGLNRLVPAIVMVLSGMVIPLPLFPNWAQPVLNFLPFRDLVDVPFRLYMGHIPVSQLGSIVAHQAVWTIALVAVGRWMVARGTRRLVVQGG